MQWLRYGMPAAFDEATRRQPMSQSTHSPHNPAAVGYAFVRYVGLILDEPSAQGLELWQDERLRWRWRWSGTDIRAERGFWALGEAVVDAVSGGVR
jgi:hypothetical protein